MKSPNPLSTQSAGGTASRYRYLVAGFCFLLGLVNYLDRVIISFAIKPIESDFGIQDASFGLLMSAFAIGTLSVNVISGFLLDRIGVKVVWSIGLFAWSIVMALQGFVEVFWMFMALRVLLGVGEGVNFPAMNRALVDWMKPSELGRSVSVSLIGVPLALLLGGLILAPLILSIGWRWSFISLGILGGLLGIVFLIFYHQPPKIEPKVEVTTEPKMPVRQVVLNPTLLATGWSFFAFGWVLFFGLSWLPGYLEQTWNMKLQSVGFSSTLPWAISIVLMPIAGWLSDKIMAKTSRTRTARVHLIWICQLLAVLFFIPVILVNSVIWAVLFVSIAIGFSMAPNSPYYSICADLFKQRAGLATGVLVTFFSISGIACPWITGWLAQAGGGFTLAFSAMCVVVGSGVLGMLLFASGRVHQPNHPAPNTNPGDTATSGT
ncbi:MAG: MFS transporter [Planctomycetota bacterium]|nr:MFS transporter [Planctomycetota bacterium]